MGGIGNTTRCPICNKYGSPDHPLGFCGKCVAEGKQPKCIVSRCDQDAVIIGETIARYCDEHLNGTDYDLHRKSFDGVINDANKGWRQELPEEYGIVRENFPIAEKR